MSMMTQHDASQPTTSPKLRLTEVLLEAKDIDLGAWLHEQRSAGHSLDRIARDLYILTDLEVAVTQQTIGRWLEDLEVAS